jgi:uncharacterized protein YgbK (DUF1537 family)
MRRWLILADDLTGAADAASAFRSAGHRVSLQLTPVPPDESASVTAVDLDLRASAEAAPIIRERVGAALSAVPPDTALYVKIDSTLRGPIRSFIGAVTEALRKGRERSPFRLVLCPAFPAQDRVTRGGIQYAHRIPVTLSGSKGEFVSSLLDAFKDLNGENLSPREFDEASILHWNKAMPLAIIGDAETDDDLDRWAALDDRIRPAFWAGSAGLAAALARRNPGGSPAPKPPPVERVVVVSGSAHPRSHEQIDALEKAIREKRFAGAERVAVIQSPRKVEGRLRPDVARELAEQASIAAREGRVGWALVGGTTAGAFLQSLKARSAEVGGEVSPGLPWMVPQTGDIAGSPVVTKAGGFGEEGTLVRIVQFLLNAETQGSL